MYDELVKRVRQVAEEVCDDYDVDPYNAEQRCFVIEEAADAIEELNCNYQLALGSMKKEYKRANEAEKQKPRWIPVTERLPEDAGVYLCRIKSFSHEFRYTDTMKYVDGFFYEQGAVTDRVTHWMPLPEPPKEE